MIKNYTLIEHSGCYSCEYRGQTSKGGCYVHAGNTQDLLKPSFYGLKTENCEDTVVFEGEPLNIKCGDIKTHPFSGEYSIYWFVPWLKNSFVESKELVLKISRVTMANNGTYFVVAKNNFGFNYVPHFNIIVKPNPMDHVITLDSSKSKDANIRDEVLHDSSNSSKIQTSFIDNLSDQNHRHAHLPFQEKYLLVYIIFCFIVAAFSLLTVYKCATRLRRNKREKVMTFAMRQRCQSPETGPRLAESKTNSK